MIVLNNIKFSIFHVFNQFNILASTADEAECFARTLSSQVPTRFISLPDFLLESILCNMYISTSNNGCKIDISLYFYKINAFYNKYLPTSFFQFKNKENPALMFLSL